MGRGAAAVARWLGLAVVAGTVTGVLGLVAVSVASTRGDVGVAVALRTAMELFALACLVAFAARRWSQHGLVFFLTAALAAYLVNPLAWTGQALVGRALLPPGAVTSLLDAVLWLLVTAAVVLLEQRREEKVAPDRDIQELLR